MIERARPWIISNRSAAPMGNGGRTAGATGFDAAAVKFDDMLYDRQSQPQSALPAVAGHMCLTEALENVGKKIGVNSNAVVRNRYPDA